MTIPIVEILRVYQEKRETHPELGRPLTWRSLQRILSREGVSIFTVAMPQPAQLACYAGAWAILVNANAPARRHTYFAAHELAHLWLHVDGAEGRDAVCYNFASFEGPDPREDDAEFLATLLLGGPHYARYF